MISVKLVKVWLVDSLARKRRDVRGSIRVAGGSYREGVVQYPRGGGQYPVREKQLIGWMPEDRPAIKEVSTALRTKDAKA